MQHVTCVTTFIKVYILSAVIYNMKNMKKINNIKNMGQTCHAYYLYMFCLHPVNYAH